MSKAQLKLPPWKNRITLLAAHLSSYGVPGKWTRHVARAIVESLRQHCYGSRSDIIGTAEEVDKAAGWDEPPQGKLAKHLEDADILVKRKGEWYMPSALGDAPESVIRDWRRKDMATYKLAKGRSELMKQPEFQKQLELFEADWFRENGKIVDLFGQPSDPDEASTVEARPSSRVIGHMELKGYWLTEWRDKYGRKYPFMPKDARHLRDILEHTDNLSHAQAVIERYLADDFWRGHPLGILVTHLPKYLATGRAKPKPGEIQEDIKVRRLGDGH